MEPYQISFSGETLPGCHPDAAKTRLAQYFNLDPESDLERYFTGEKTVLKRLLDRDAAVSTYQDLRRLGIVVIIEKMDPEEAAEAQRKLEQQQEAARQKQAEQERQAARQLQVQQRREQAEREAAKRRAREARAARKIVEQHEAEQEAAREQAAKEKAAAEKAAKEKATKEKAAKAKAAKEQAAREKVAAEKAAAEKAAEDKAAGEKAAREEAAKTKAAREKASQEEAARHKPGQKKRAKAKSSKPKTPQQQAARKATAPEAKQPIKAESPAAPSPAAQQATARPAPKVPTPRASSTGSRRRRQAGAPNVFDVRLSEGALKDAQARHEHFSGAPMLGAAIMLVAFVLVGMRFWVESLDRPASGLGPVAVDSAERPAVVINDQLLRHDRAGNPGELMDLAAIGLSPATSIAFMESGALLQQLPPSGQGLPVWLRNLLNIDAQPGRLQQCTLRDAECELLLEPLNEGAFTLNRDGGYLVVADVLSNRLMKYDRDGNALASHPIALSSPVHLAVQDGVLYLTQGNSDVVKALRTENDFFGQELGLYTLAVDGAQATGHIFPAALAWLGQHWWVVMQSRDSSTAGLYRFDTRWQAEDAVPLPESAHPGQPVPWGEKLLVPDARRDMVYRVAADNSLEASFSEEPIAAALLNRRSQIEQIESLQAVIMLMLFFATTGLFIFGSVKSLQGKIYQAVNDTDEKAFDIESDSIEWLDPGRDARALLRRCGFVLGGLTFLLLAMAIILKPGLGITVAALVVLAGVGGYGYAIYQSWGCHLGRLGDQLVVVDHKSTYRVGRGPRIQYVHNYVMIDDVIVYLGNPLLPQFADKPLQQEFEPIVTRGIKVDRTTLRLKLINSRHPMLYGNAGLIFSLGVALIILLFA